MNKLFSGSPFFALLFPLTLSLYFSSRVQAETIVPKATANFKAEILKERIKNQDVIRISRTTGLDSKRPQMVSVDLAKGAGMAPIAWNVRLADGREYNLTGAVEPAAIETAFEKDAANPFRDNLFFQNGVVASLFPFANRLTGKTIGNHLLLTTVMGQTVKMPLNNTASIPDAIPHHLHGLVFGQVAADPANGKMIELTTESAKVTGEFHVGPDLWTGKTKVTTTAELTDGGYIYHMKVVNIGETPVPVGAGSHPYFASPDMDRDSIRIHVPARSLVEIDNLSNVLPTGKITPIAKSDPALNFTKPEGTPLFASDIKGNSTASRFDNLWVDLDRNPQGYAYAEVFFPKSHMKVELTALTRNVIGIQGYAPKFVEGRRPFVVLELVTNLPDPREELWGKTPTGMTLLKPGETFQYAYKVELKPM